MLKSNKYLWFSLLLAALITLLIMLPRLTSPYSAEDDFRNWYWMHRFQDADLFVNDYWVNDYVLEMNLGPLRLVTLKASPLYGLIYQLLSNLIPVILLGKLLVFPLTLTAVYYLYRICTKFVTPQNAFVISIVFVLLDLSLTSMVSTVGGFQRSFVLPLLLAFLFYMLEGRLWGTAVVLFVSGMLYPPLFLLQMVTFGLELLLSWWPNRRTEAGRKYAKWLGGAVLIGLITLLLLLPVLRRLLANVASFNLAANWQAMFDATTFGADGRSRMFLIFPIVGRGGIADHGITILVIMFLALFALAIVVWQPERLQAFPRIFKSLFWASWISFALAWMGFLATASFLLYLPSRYTQSGLLLVLFLFVMLHAFEAFSSAAKWLTMHMASLVWLNVPLALVLGGLFFVLPEPEIGTVAFGRGLSRWLLLGMAVFLLILTALSRLRPSAAAPTKVPKPVNPRMKIMTGTLLVLMGIAITWGLQPFLTYFRATDAEIAMFKYLQTLPKDVLLAGNPGVMDAVPLFSQRKALFTRDHIHPDAELVQDFLLAYYADTGEALLAFCQNYDVDYLVVNQDDFMTHDDGEQTYFYEPYQSAVAPVIEQRSAFVLAGLPDDVRAFQQDNLYVVPCAEDAFGR
ncbi:MAG: hypothetical protein H6662_01520 [Ardenticatenaceae bacterium]|nr:hypothetical protein [Anaerolineales bacterium]MCB8920236.1 hypothetical protein [Ardenticatenaceae bacterium]MCB8991969.1 hypothetical protein [Ardenticatenaceae bacterium]MCB9004908.1 hypothetical protein [Ardenticatenaceae bacterium]